MMLFAVSFFVSLAVLALQYDVEGAAARGNLFFNVDINAVLINSSVPACVSQPVRQTIAALMRHLGSERRPVRQLTEPEMMLQMAASVVYKRRAFAKMNARRRERMAAESIDAGSYSPIAQARLLQFVLPACCHEPRCRRGTVRVDTHGEPEKRQ